MNKDKKATQWWKKPENLQCDGGKNLSFSLHSFLTTTVNAQILDPWSTRIRQEKTIIKTNWMLVWLTGVVFYFYPLNDYCQSEQTWCLHLRWMLLDHRSQTAQHHLTCFFSHFPPPRLLYHILKITNPLACAFKQCLIRPKDTLEDYRKHHTFILCNCSLLNACCFCRDWYFTFTLISCRSISALRSSTYRTLWTIITVKSQHLLSLGWWVW